MRLIWQSTKQHDQHASDSDETYILLKQRPATESHVPEGKRVDHKTAAKPRAEDDHAFDDGQDHPIVISSNESSSESGEDDSDHSLQIPLNRHTVTKSADGVDLESHVSCMSAESTEEAHQDTLPQACDILPEEIRKRFIALPAMVPYITEHEMTMTIAKDVILELTRHDEESWIGIKGLVRAGCKEAELYKTNALRSIEVALGQSLHAVDLWVDDKGRRWIRYDAARFWGIKKGFHTLFNNLDKFFRDNLNQRAKLAKGLTGSRGEVVKILGEEDIIKSAKAMTGQTGPLSKPIYCCYQCDMFFRGSQEAIYHYHRQHPT